MRYRLTASILFVTIAMALAACNKPVDSAAPAEQPAAPAEAATQAPAPEAAPAADTAPEATEAAGFKANGFSPAWRAEVDGDTVKLDVPEHGRIDQGFNTASATKASDGAKTTYTGKDGKVDFTLTLDGSSRCKLASDENGKTDREFSATLKYGNSTYQGCADKM